jgi:hypothetical protein
MTGPVLYARVVAGFSASVPPAAVDAVIELARALGAELHAVLLEDLASAVLAEFPSSRAIDPRSAIWHDVQRHDLLREIELTTSMLRRRLEAARSRGVQTEVAVLRAGAAALLQEYARSGDLLVVIEPVDPMARWVQPFADMLDAALNTSAPLLYLPHRGARNVGPVVSIGGTVADELAQRLVQALGAPLARAAEPGAPGAASLQALLPRLREIRARVAVCSRAALAPDAPRTLHAAGDQRLAVLLAPDEGRR